MNKLRIPINWILYITGPIWMVIMFYVIECYLFSRMLYRARQGQDTPKCNNYKALFRGDRWLVTKADFLELIE